MSVIHALWQEFRQPSRRNPDPHHRAATGIWHAALGALPVLASERLGPTAMGATAALLLLIYVWKEAGDLKRGGVWRDSIEDTAFVAFGAGAAHFDALIGLIGVNALALFVMQAQIKKRAFNRPLSPPSTGPKHPD